MTIQVIGVATGVCLPLLPYGCVLVAVVRQLICVATINAPIGNRHAAQGN